MNLNGPKTFSYYGLHIELTNEENCHAVINSAVDCTEFEFTHKVFRPGDRVLVAGGGMGSVAAWTAMRVGASNVFIFEANPDLVSSMVHNVRFEGQIPNVTWGALSTHNGTAEFYIRDHWGGSSLDNTDASYSKSVTVDTYDINDVISRNNINAISLDVEGAEFELIPHLNIQSINKIVMEIHADLEQAQQLIDSIGRHEFRIQEWHTQHPKYPLHVVGMVRTSQDRDTSIIPTNSEINVYTNPPIATYVDGILTFVNPYVDM